MEFTLPSSIRDFIFDLHQSSRVSLLPDEVAHSYENKFKELTDKYFATSAWPDCEAISSECKGDQVFLLFYKEMITRHAFAKLKTNTNDYVSAWSTYNKLFAYILSTPEPNLCLTTQWVHDMLSEYVYQFQGYCQYRTSIIGSKNTTNEELKLLDQNKDIWTLPIVYKTLSGLINLGARSKNASTTHQLFHTFATVEMARLECLLGDYTSSLKYLTPISLSTNDLKLPYIKTITTCYINMYYHSGVSQLMLRRHVDALDTFIEIALFLHNILKPMNNSGNEDTKNDQKTNKKNQSVYVHSPLSKFMDKILSLLCITISLCPGHRLDDQIKELIESNNKYNDKLRKLQLLSSTASSAPAYKQSKNAPAVPDATVDTTASQPAQQQVTILNDMFESACPKFVSPAVPTYNGVLENLNQQFFTNQIAIFIDDSNQLLSILKIRSYLKVYATIDIAKVARMSNSNESSFLSQLICFKCKTKQLHIVKVISTDSSSSTDTTSHETRVTTSDIEFTVDDKVLRIEEFKKRSKNDIAERFFITGIRKHVDQSKDINRLFNKHGL